jgi:DegV family protein with EDD domain
MLGHFATGYTRAKDFSMRIVTNPGSNLSDEEIARYRVHVLPQKVVVDGSQHDTREGMTHALVERWVRTAREFPHVLGTSAAEFVDAFRKIAQSEGEILAIQTSRKIIGSHTAACSAARTLTTLPGYESVRIEVVDTMSTDLGAGLCTILAAESVRAGRTIGQTAEVVERFAGQGVLMLTLATLDNLVKGGRASFLRAMLANVLDVTPMLSFVDGELAAVGRTSRRGDTVGAQVDAIVARIGAGRPVWCGVAHGDDPRNAARLMAELRKKLLVVFAIERPLSQSIFLHTGAGAVGAFVYPIDRLPWTPPTPSSRRAPI